MSKHSLVLFRTRSYPYYTYILNQFIFCEFDGTEKFLSTLQASSSESFLHPFIIKKMRKGNVLCILMCVQPSQISNKIIIGLTHSSWYIELTGSQMNCLQSQTMTFPGKKARKQQISLCCLSIRHLQRLSKDIVIVIVQKCNIQSGLRSSLQFVLKMKKYQTSNFSFMWSVEYQKIVYTFDIPRLLKSNHILPIQFFETNIRNIQTQRKSKTIKIST